MDEIWTLLFIYDWNEGTLSVWICFATCNSCYLEVLRCICSRDFHNYFSYVPFGICTWGLDTVYGVNDFDSKKKHTHKYRHNEYCICVLVEKYKSRDSESRVCYLERSEWVRSLVCWLLLLLFLRFHSIPIFSYRNVCSSHLLL